MMAGKLGTDSAYQGIVFTAGLRDKLQAITTGSFAYTDSNGTSHAQVEGYVMTSQVVGELKKKADRLLGGYSASEKETVATNLDLYTKAGADARFATLENLFQDYINFLVRQGKSTSEAQQFLQGKLNVLSKNEIVRDYLRRDSKPVRPSAANGGGQTAGLPCSRSLLMPRSISRCLRIQDGYRWRTADRVPTHSRSSSAKSGTSFPYRVPSIRPTGTETTGEVSWRSSPTKYNHPGTVCAAPPLTGMMTISTTVGYRSPFTAAREGYSLYERGMYNANVELNFTYFV